jgi:hypothetical protein
MRRAALLVLAVAAFAQRPLNGASRAILVELFTAEGCSSCPPADALLQRMVSAPPPGVDLIALGEHVDYWDRLGWKDRFSSAALTNRQQVYGSRFGTQSIYTPQMVVDGRDEFVGSDGAAARRAIDRAAALPHGTVQIAVGSEVSPITVTVSATDLPAVGHGDHADILVAITEDGLSSDVKRGENHGRVLAHAAVVRQLITIGEAAGPSASARAEVKLSADWRRERLKVVAFVQERRARTVLGAAAVALGDARR